MAVDLIARGLAASAKKKADAAPSQADLDKKLDKVTAGSANPQLYGVSEDGEQTMYFATQTASANTVPMRDASGRFQVADGVAPKQAVNKEQLDTKMDTAGGTFAGNVAIQGDLTVSGTTTTENEKQLAVEENVIVTNSKKVDLQTLLSGLAINKNADATYGIMYDPADDTVKFGEGTLDNNRKFVFNAGEGKPIAIRAAASEFTDAHLIKWDESTNSFVDAGVLVDDLAHLKEQNAFSGLNTFQEDVQFDKGLNTDGDVVVTNAVLKVMNNTDNGDGTNKDYVAQYDADKIMLEENGANYELQFPKKSGIFATLSDITGGTDLKHSELVNVDTADAKEDAWRLNDDDAALSIYHENTTTKTGIALSKNHIRLGAQEQNNGDTTSVQMAFTSDSITIAVNDTAAASSTTFSINENGAKLNGKDLVTSEGLDGKLNILEASVVSQVYARDAQGDDTGISFSYAAEGGTIAQRSAAGTLAVETPTQDNDAANKKFVETQCANIPKGVVISDVTGSTSGILAEPDFQALSGNANNYILKDGKKYERSSDRSSDDSLTYVYNGYLSNRQLQEAIEITVSAKSWVLNSDKLLTDRTIANGKIGGVSIKEDFTDGLQVSQTDGNLSIYGALDVDIAGRNSKRPITPINLNKAVIAALTDDSKEIPTEDQQAAFKAAWGFTASQYELAECVEITPAAATNGTLTDDQYATLISSDENYIKLNNEYYYLSDDGHTEGIRTYTHTGWNGNANQNKSINITKSTKAWTLVVGYSKYYRHYIKATLSDGKILYYDFSSTQLAAYTLDTLPVQPDDSHSQFTLLVGGYYSTVNGQVYRSGDNTPKMILNGLYTSDGTTFAYLAQTGTEITAIVDEVVDR